jgi:nicotinate phosphoribosyltransferase
MLEGLMLTSGYINDDDGDIALATDFYELTMAAAYHDALIETHPSSDHTNKEKKGIFEMFVRRLPLHRSYLVAAGLEQAIYYLMKMRFNDKQISYLKSHKTFKYADQSFFEYLKRFRFTGTVWAVPKGEPFYFLTNQSSESRHQLSKRK